MTREKQVVLELDFSLYFTEGTPGADAVHYLKHGPLEVKQGVRLAIAAVFSAVGAALQGKAKSEVVENISTGREAVLGFAQEALFRLENSCSEIESFRNRKVEEQSSELIDQKNEVF